jgi:hypothetical protein
MILTETETKNPSDKFNREVPNFVTMILAANNVKDNKARNSPITRLLS